MCLVKKSTLSILILIDNPIQYVKFQYIMEYIKFSSLDLKKVKLRCQDWLTMEQLVLALKMVDKKKNKNLLPASKPL